ncbi:MAG: hypothetical protein IJB11_08240 [Oscillospiraceae bacterium]|nr:hypothetical protein [Oscillospiraceae bacterium]
MKRLFALILALTVVLCGCGKEEEPKQSATATITTPTTTTTPEQDPSDPPKVDFGCYVPDSDVEKATSGAVKAYNIDFDDCYGVLPLGEGLVLFSGTLDTELTYLAPDGTTASLTLTGSFMLPQDMVLVPEREAMGYYDQQNRAMILLDTSLEEIDRVELPEDIVGIPVADSDWSMVYFFTEDELRCMTISTGIDRMLKEISFPVQEIQKLHFDGTVLECLILEDDMSQIMMFNTSTGELLYASEKWPTVATWDDRYFATCYENGVLQYLFGTRGGDTQRLKVDDPVYLEIPQMMAAVCCVENESSMKLDYYDLQTGVRASSVELSGMFIPECLAADPQREAIWFIAVDQEFNSGLYRWDFGLSQTGDTECLTEPYYTEQEPDMDGLAQIEERADALGLEYGIRIRVYEDAVRIQPSDYVFELEHSVAVYEYYLDLLEQALTAYPDGFLKKVGTTSDNGKLTISLVGEAFGDNDMGSLDTAVGVHFYNDGNVYIALVMCDDFVTTLYHETFHAIDTYVLSHCNVYDDWEKLNPKGFQYDNDYVTNQFREDYQYLEEDRWFIDMYSMSYAKEDRARIMEYAIREGNEEYFQSEHMQAKLQLLCRGIRKAFGLQNKSERFLWEQYLK